MIEKCQQVFHKGFTCNQPVLVPDNKMPATFDSRIWFTSEHRRSAMSRFCLGAEPADSSAVSTKPSSTTAPKEFPPRNETKNRIVATRDTAEQSIVPFICPREESHMNFKSNVDLHVYALCVRSRLLLRQQLLLLRYVYSKSLSFSTFIIV